MSLGPGTRIGAYEILSAIGAGGMGEVYRARDSRLQRDVAIKVLPDLFAADPDRLARFEREAQILASLNHPHIATIYGLEQAQGAQCLVMELVEGDTLAQRIAAAPIPLSEALTIARQVGDALSAAHEKGIIHRDLKPANIALTADGQVKVLDFGLAKALDPVPSAEVTFSPTLSLAATNAGVILGTAAYMAPEQARGRAADKRSDLWAFGCVLYEMLAGRRAFEGEDAAETMAFVMAREPDWTLLPADVPAPIRVLLRRCLEKDRRKRLGDVAAALVLIDEAPALTASTAAVAVTRSARVPIAIIGAAAVVLAGIVSGAIWWTMRPSPKPLIRTEVTTSGAMELSLNRIDRDLAITPDGSRLVYRGTNQLLVRPLDALEPHALSGLGAPRGVFISPDGQWIGFFDGNSLLKKVAITGGPPVTIAQVDGAGPRGASWSRDGAIVYATNAQTTGLHRVSAAGGNPTVLTKPDVQHGEQDHVWPEFLPTGRAVLFTITAANTAANSNLDNAQIAVLDLMTGHYRVVLRGGSHAHYLSTGHLVYGAGGTLRAVAFDLDRLEVAGTPVPVVENVTATPTGAVDMSVAANGTLAYVPGNLAISDAVRSLLWVDRRGREYPIAAPSGPYVYPRLSPDGTRVALDINSGRNRDIWVWDLLRETLTRLTTDPLLDRSPAWTRDGHRIVFSSSRAALTARTGSNLYWQNADGTGQVEQLTQTALAHFAPTFAPDGKTLVFHEQQTDGTSDIMMTIVGGDRHAGALIRTKFTEENPEISSDGHWIAFDSDASGRFEVYVRPFPGVEHGQWQVSTLGGVQPVWSRDGRELFYRAPNGAIMSVPIQHGSEWSAGKPAEVVKAGYFAGNPGLPNRTYDVASDGRFLVIKEQSASSTAAPTSIVIVQNWFEELKRLVPQ